MVKAVYKNNGCGRKPHTLQITSIAPHSQGAESLGWVTKWLKENLVLNITQNIQIALQDKRTHPQFIYRCGLSPVFQVLTPDFSWFLKISVPFPDLWLAPTDPWKHQSSLCFQHYSLLNGQSHLKLLFHLKYKLKYNLYNNINIMSFWC